MNKSQSLLDYAGAAGQMAIRSKHQYIMPEHIILAILKDEKSDDCLQVAKTLKDANIDLAFARNALFKYLEEFCPKTQETKQNLLLYTNGFHTLIKKSLSLAKTNQKNQPDAFDMWVTFLEEQSFDGSHILRSMGLDVEALKAKHYIHKESNKAHPESALFSQFGINLTDLAIQKKIEPVVGRKELISEIALDLKRKRKNSILLVGDPGVGKTSLINGLAQELISNKETKELRVWNIDPGSLVSGTKYRGDFEERMKRITALCKEHKEIILFIDEVHLIMGLGSTGKANADVANLIKPALSRGEMRLIGATTPKEAQEIEKDKALKRRFVKRRVDEPSSEDATQMVESLLPHFQDHHHVKFKKEAAAESVRLAKLYVRDLKLPDSAIDLIDFIGSRNQNSDIQIGKKEIFKEAQKAFSIPFTKLPKESTPSKIKQGLSEVIFNQEEAISTLYKVMMRSKAGFGNKEKPLGSFLFNGTTGVGKTELAKQFAKTLGLNFIRFDLSEYQEPHSISKLIGAPAGYVGHENESALFTAIKTHPNSVVLFDEVEKAHESIHKLFLQMMDYGTLTNSHSETIDLKKCFIIFTSNLGAEKIEKPLMGFTHQAQATTNKSYLEEEIKKYFKPEFRNRLDEVICFNLLDQKSLAKVARKTLNETALQVAEKLEITFDPAIYDTIAKEVEPLKMGARPVARWVADYVELPIAEWTLKMKSTKIKKLHLHIKPAVDSKTPNQKIEISQLGK